MSINLVPNKYTLPNPNMQYTCPQCQSQMTFGLCKKCFESKYSRGRKAILHGPDIVFPNETILANFSLNANVLELI